MTDEERNELQTLLRRVHSASRDEETGKARQSRSKSRTTTPPEDSPQQVNRALEIKIACGCGQRLLLDAAAAGREFQCIMRGRFAGARHSTGQFHTTPNCTDRSVTQSQSFSLVQLTQGTPEWLKYGVTKGSAHPMRPYVMGESPWKTPKELLQQKCGWAPATEVNAAMARGTALEPEARQAYISRTGKWVQPACLQSTAYDWLRASVDGITPALDGMVEIKCGESVYRSTSETGCAPDYYYGQLQHIMAVTGLRSIDFWCYLSGFPELLVPVRATIVTSPACLRQNISSGHKYCAHAAEHLASDAGHLSWQKVICTINLS